MALAAKFWPKVDKSGGPNACWPWIGAVDNGGYGRGIHSKSTANKRSHRIAYLLTHGEWPTPCGLHTCDNPPCCNPSHIHPGSNEENTADRCRKGRSASGDGHGSRTRPERLARGDNHYSRTRPHLLARGDRSGARLHPESRARGEAHWAAKLTESDVRRIRKLYGEGVGGPEIGRMFGIDRHMAANIFYFRNWKHVK